jgi:hypothetical protein
MKREWVTGTHVSKNGRLGNGGWTITYFGGRRGIAGRGSFCPVCRPDRTKMFHVKHFGPIDTLRKRTFANGSWYEAGIWGKRTFAIGFMLGCGCLPRQTIVATHRGADAKIFLRSARKSNRPRVHQHPLHFSRTSILPGNRLVRKSRFSLQGANWGLCGFASMPDDRQASKMLLRLDEVECADFSRGGQLIVDFVVQVITSAAVSAVFSGVLVWFFRLWISERLSVRPGSS